MIIIVCLDDGNGMLFNKRRQSSDEVLTNRVAKLSAKSRLWVNEYSAKLFEKHEVSVSEDFLKEAADGEYCFVENADITEFTEKIEGLIIYRWNRKYPSDFKFPISILEKMKLVSTQNFVGKSHPEITEEIYSL